jgi:hypothetical protein
MKRVLIALALLAVIAATTSSARAIPGQTEKQLAAWGKSNVALPGFKRTNDDNTGGNDYMADLNVDGIVMTFSSEPESGVVRKEYLSLHDVPDTYALAKHPQFIRDMLRVVYGVQYEKDFATSNMVPLHGRVVVWQGKRLAYAVFGDALFMINNADFPAVLKNIHSCDAIDCTD